LSAADNDLLWDGSRPRGEVCELDAQGQRNPDTMKIQIGTVPDSEFVNVYRAARGQTGSVVLQKEFFGYRKMFQSPRNIGLAKCRL